MGLASSQQTVVRGGPAVIPCRYGAAMTTPVKSVGTPVSVGAPGAVPPAVSPSSLASFRSCPLKFYFSYAAGWRTRPTEHTVIGNVTHRAVELLYKEAPAARTRAAATAHLRTSAAAERARPDVARLLGADRTLDATVEERCEHMLDGLFSLEDPTQVQVRPGDCEAWVQARLYGAEVRGRIDRMTGVAAGVWRISDYKTGKPAKPAFIETALFGLFTYAATLAASEPNRRLPDEVELLYLRERVRVNRPVVRDYLLAHAKTVGRTWRGINAAHTSRTWEARVSPLCKFCEFAPGCPLKARGAIPAVGTVEHDDLLIGIGLIRRTPRAVGGPTS